MNEHKELYDQLETKYTETYRYFQNLLNGRTGTLNRKHSRYHGRKITIFTKDNDGWLNLSPNLTDSSYFRGIVDIGVKIGIERKDGRDDYIWDHSESHARLSEIIFDEPLP